MLTDVIAGFEPSAAGVDPKTKAGFAGAVDVVDDDGKVEGCPDATT